MNAVRTVLTAVAFHLYKKKQVQKNTKVVDGDRRTLRLWQASQALLDGGGIDMMGSGETTDKE